MTDPDKLRFVEPDGSNREEIRRLGYRFIDLIVEAEADAGRRTPVPDGPAGPDVVATPYVPSVGGRDPDELLQLLKNGILDRSLNPAHPGYVGHMDSLASAVGIFSDAVVSACNNNMLSYEMSLVFTRMEGAVLGWAMRQFGWPDGGRGFLVSGGTLANIQAVWTARNAILGRSIAEEGLAGSGGRPVIIASEHAHYSFIKAANLLGLGRDALLTVPAEVRVAPRDVEEMILRAKLEGMRPFCLVGVAGTTVTGAIEPLEEMAEVARRHGLWFHVDGAYGGSLVLSDRLRGALRGIERADSITWNPQKWLYVPKTCASILFREGGVLDATVRERFVYGREDSNGRRPNLGEYTIQGTRRVDILKLWLTLEHFGVAYLAGLMEEQVERARWLADRIEENPDLALVTQPDMNIVCFRVQPRGIDASEVDRLDALQSAVQQEVARRGHGWLSMPSYRGRRVLRAVILHPRCDREVLARLLQDVSEASRAVSS
jgi:glutamate/tyrosine decarboxylase-like PLP-dependent enzyme